MLMPKDFQQLLDAYIECAVSVLKRQYGVDRAEPLFIAVENLIDEIPGLKDYMLERVIKYWSLFDPRSLLGNECVPIELIEFLAHSKRWDELREIAEDRINKKFKNDKTFAVCDPSTRVLHALEEGWDDKIFYKRFGA